MRLLIDFFPIALFVAAYKFQDIYLATAVLMAATLIQTGLMYALDKRLPTMQKITLALIFIFGTLTLVFQNESFIKWKPTVLYFGMALVLGLALWIWKKNFLQMLLGSQLQLPQPAWVTLTYMWVIYFVFMGSINAYVAVYFTTDEWVNFKIWGYIFPLLFLVVQGIYIAKHLKQEQNEETKTS
jgi:intracellular septation protein